MNTAQVGDLEGFTGSLGLKAKITSVTL